MSHIKELARSLGSALMREGRRIASAWSDARAGTYGASTAYYAIFSLAPVLVIAIAVMGLFVESADATARIVAEFSNLFGSQGAEFVATILQAGVSEEAGLLGIVLGIATLFLGATGVFSELEEALDGIFGGAGTRDGRGFWDTLRRRALSLGLVVSIGFVMLVSLLLSALITALSSGIGGSAPGAGIVAQVAESVVSLGLVSLFLGITYRVLPSRSIAWKPALTGGLIAGILFTASKYLLGLYLGTYGGTGAFGPAAALVLIILWAYYMAQVFFFAAIVTKLYAIEPS